jgi:hypothetical protein
MKERHADLPTSDLILFPFVVFFRFFRRSPPFVASPLKSGAGAPHSKTLARPPTHLPNFREVLECGGPPPLCVGGEH